MSKSFGRKNFPSGRGRGSLPRGIKFIEYSFYLHDCFKIQRYSIVTAKNCCDSSFHFHSSLFSFCTLPNAEASRRFPVKNRRSAARVLHKIRRGELVDLSKNILGNRLQSPIEYSIMNSKYFYVVPCAVHLPRGYKKSYKSRAALMTAAPAISE